MNSDRVGEILRTRRIEAAADRFYHVRYEIRSLLHDYQGLTREAASGLTDEYLQFIVSKAESPRDALPLSEAIDNVWRLHILDTASYRKLICVLRCEADCIDYKPHPQAPVEVKTRREATFRTASDRGDVQAMLVFVQDGVRHALESLEGMALVAAQEVATEYMKFMKLKALYPEAQLSPSGAVDRAWHAHLLDTASYRRLAVALRCSAEALDHKPAKDARPGAFQERLLRTIVFYEKIYGSAIPELWTHDQDFERVSVDLLLGGAADPPFSTHSLLVHAKTSLGALNEFILIAQYGSTKEDCVVVTEAVGIARSPLFRQEAWHYKHFTATVWRGHVRATEGARTITFGLDWPLHGLIWGGCTNAEVEMLPDDLVYLALPEIGRAASAHPSSLAQSVVLRVGGMTLPPDTLVHELPRTAKVEICAKPAPLLRYWIVSTNPAVLPRELSQTIEETAKAGELVFAVATSVGRCPLSELSMEVHGTELNPECILDCHCELSALDMIGPFRRINVALRSDAELEVPFRIIIKTLTGKEIMVHVRASQSVYFLKIKIWGSKGVPVENQRLISMGRR